MSTNGLKSSQKHPYQLAYEARTVEPVEWQKVDFEWILRYGGVVERKKLKNSLFLKKETKG